jgi:hypothetical protein
MSSRIIWSTSAGHQQEYDQYLLLYKYLSMYTQM